MYQLLRQIALFCRFIHYGDVIMTTIASQITSLSVVYSIVYSDADQRKHQSSASLAFVWGIHRDRWIPRAKGQLRGKCFHLMTSSCYAQKYTWAERRTYNKEIWCIMSWFRPFTLLSYFLWLCVWVVPSHSVGNFCSYSYSTVWWCVQIIRYMMAWQSHSFVYVLWYRNIIIKQTFSEGTEHFKCLSGTLCRVCV